MDFPGALVHPNPCGEHDPHLTAKSFFFLSTSVTEIFPSIRDSNVKFPKIIFAFSPTGAQFLRQSIITSLNVSVSFKTWERKLANTGDRQCLPVRFPYLGKCFLHSRLHWFVSLGKGLGKIQVSVFLSCVLPTWPVVLQFFAQFHRWILKLIIFWDREWLGFQKSCNFGWSGWPSKGPDTWERMYRGDRNQKS